MSPLPRRPGPAGDLDRVLADARAQVARELATQWGALPDHELAHPHQAGLLVTDPGAVDGCPPRCPRRAAAEAAGLVHPATTAGPTPTPQEWARHLDGLADAAGRAYRRAVHAADAAWRQIGGRP